MIYASNNTKTPAKIKLTDEQIRHIKAWGNNITIFIHGFDVAYGQYPKQIERVEMVDVKADGVSMPIMAKIPKMTYSSSDRTIYRDLDILSKKFPTLQEMNPAADCPELMDDERMNGTEAHNWFIHIEDNLNRATGQFKRDDYRKFTRCLHVTWSGDVGVRHYMASEEKADAAGDRLQAVIKQLHEQKIKINIIAHSMGNRVLLKMMDLLGDDKNKNNNDSDIIEHVFMCQAAVPQNALSNDPTKDISIKQNCHFIHATKVAKKISVLYSKHDGVLMIDYPAGNRLSMTRIQNGKKN